jgi:hypothetical protein
LQVEHRNSTLVDRHLRTRSGSKHAEEDFRAVDLEPELPSLSVGAQVRGRARSASATQAGHGVSELGQQREALGAPRSRGDIHAIDEYVEHADQGTFGVGRTAIGTENNVDW